LDGLLDTGWGLGGWICWIFRAGGVAGLDFVSWTFDGSASKDAAWGKLVLDVSFLSFIVRLIMGLSNAMEQVIV
jgi:hypothetical protein